MGVGEMGVGEQGPIRHNLSIATPVDFFLQVLI